MGFEQNHSQASVLGKALLSAINVGDSDSVRDLLAAGADPNFAGAGQCCDVAVKCASMMGGAHLISCPAVVLAAIKGNECCVEMLFAAGADLGVPMEVRHPTWDESKSAPHEFIPVLEAAALSDSGGSHDDVIRVLLAAGANTLNKALIVNMKRSAGRLAELLLDYPQQQAVLDVAIAEVRSMKDWAGNDITLRVATKLLDAGARPIATVLAGGVPNTNALQSAATFGPPELLRLLIDRGADVSGDAGVAALDWACRYGTGGDCIRILGKSGLVPTAEMLNQVVGSVLRERDDDKLCATMEVMHVAGVDPRGVSLTDRRVEGMSLIDFIIRNNFEASTRLAFEVFGEDPYGKTAGGAPLTRIASPASRAVIMSCRSILDMTRAIDDGDEAPDGASSQPKPSMGLL